MNAEQLKQAGFSDQELGEYTKLQQAGFSDREIVDHLSGGKETPTENPKKSVGGFVKNVGKDIYGIGSGLVGLVTAPPAEGMPWEKGSRARTAAERLAEPFITAYQNPSGIPEQIGNYLYEKPVSAAMNVSTGAGLLGKAAEIGGAGRLASIAEKGSEWTNPLAAASRVGKSVFMGAEEPVAKTLMESSIKIPPTVPKELRDQAISTLRKEEVTVSEKGLAKNRTMIDNLNDEIANTIDTGAKAGEKINMNSAVSRIDSLKDFYKDYPRAKKYLDELDEIKADILKQNPTEVPIDQAQRMKQRIYQINRKHYGEMKSVEIEADKATARGLKEEIVSKHPELKNLNDRESAMLNLDEFLERAVNRIGNYNIIRLGDTVLATTGAVVGGPAGAGITVLANHILSMPAFKSRLAIALDRARKIPAVSSGAANAAFQGQQLMGQQ